jgi:lipid A 3-O-deacylase
LKTTPLALVLSLLTLAAAPALAQEEVFNEDLNDTPDRILLSLGYYDVSGDHEALDARIELRAGESVLIENLKPWAGLELTSDASIWGGGGLLYEWDFLPDWYLIPSFGAGFYTEGDSDLDLDYPVQFRSQLEVNYEFDNKSRMGLGLSHMSNFDLGDSNPGVESLNLSVAFPY